MKLLPYALLLLIPALAEARKAPKPYKDTDLCGLGKVINRHRLATDFYHVTQVNAVKEEYEYLQSRLGKCRSFEKQMDGYRAFMVEGTVDFGLDFTDSGELLKVEISSAARTNDSYALAIADFSGTAVRPSYFLAKNGEAILSRDDDKPFSAPRSRYIQLLGQLSDQVQKKGTAWAAVVPIENAKKAEKAEFLNQFPEGSLFTVDTLKNFVLFYEDGSAADHLLALLDRNALNRLERKQGYFLSNRERDELAAGKVASLKVNGADGRPLEITKANLGWHLATRDACAGLYKLRDDPALLRRNTIVEERQKNASLFFDWGKDTFLVTKLWKSNGQWFCASIAGEQSREISVAYEILHLTLDRIERIAGQN
ncbi:MAG TPA: serine hydrolase [Bdellovibrionota bacterium]|jgi:hypothetical protein